MSEIAWQRLGQYLRDTQLLGSIENTLYWDQNTTMPSSGASWRGEQLSLMARLLHSRQTSKVYEELLGEAKLEFKDKTSLESLGEQEFYERSKNIEILEKDLKRQKSLDPDLVSELAIAKSKGYNTWKEAKEKNDFSLFANALKHLIKLRKEQANQLNESLSCWETLAQPFEPDITISRLDELFSPLRVHLPRLIDKTRSWPSSSSIDNWDIDELKQKYLCDLLLKDLGRNKNISSLARSPHPFSITLGPQDFRLTTRIVKGNPLSSLLATAHEWGHSLYEQGLLFRSHQWFSWPLGRQPQCLFMKVNLYFGRIELLDVVNFQIDFGLIWQILERLLLLGRTFGEPLIR